VREILANKRKKDPDGLRDWYQNGGCANGEKEGLDVHKWDVFDINSQLFDIRA